MSIKMITSKTELKKVRVITKAAEEGDFSKVPKSYMIRQYFEHQDSMGMNALHIASTFGNLNKIPNEFLLEELLLEPDNGGETVLHYAATHGQMGSIPKEFLTIKNLSIQDEEKNTVYHYLVNYGTLKQIPKSLIKKEIILEKNEFGKDLIDFAIHAEAKEENPELDQAQMLLNILPKKTLERILQEEKLNKPIHGRLVPDNSKRINLFKKELKKRMIFDNIKKEEQSIEI